MQKHFRVAISSFVLLLLCGLALAEHRTLVVKATELGSGLRGQMLIIPHGSSQIVRVQLLKLPSLTGIGTAYSNYTVWAVRRDGSQRLNLGIVRPSASGQGDAEFPAPDWPAGYTFLVTAERGSMAAAPSEKVVAFAPGLPLLVEEGYQGHNIIFYGGKFYGLAQAEGAFDIDKVGRRGYGTEVAVGGSVREVRAELDRLLKKAVTDKKPRY